MQKSSKLGFLYVLIAAVAVTLFAYFTGSNGIEAFYAASISLYFMLVWFSIQLLKHLFSRKVWLIAKLFLTLALMAFLLVALMITVASLPIGNGQAVNGWLVLFGIAPFIIPRLGVYRKIKSTNKLSAGLLVSFFSMILLYIASGIFQKDGGDIQEFILVLVVQFQLVFTYLTLQTNYVERSIDFVLSACKRIGIKYDVGRMYILLFTAGLPFILPILILFYFAL